MKKKIAIIGGGNLGIAIAEGLLAAKFCKPADIIITRRNLILLDGLKKRGVHITADNTGAVRKSDVIILAVKPYQAGEAIAGFKKELLPGKIFISVVTGVWIAELEELVKKKLAWFRAMPNTAIAIGESMTCICAANATIMEKKYVLELFGKLGKAVYISENLMDAATILGACGTAYAMRYVRASIQGGIEIGFDAATASLIAAQTVKGAAQLLLEKGTHPEQEIDKVTTPRGCTIAGLNEMEHRGFSSSLIRGIVTSYHKIAKD